MYTIGKLAKMFSLSRSTLLYYDSIGLLSPSGRSDANYRLYSEADKQRMQKIDLYREAGLPLESISRLLALKDSDMVSVLEEQLHRIHEEFQKLRQQQRVILKLLENESTRNGNIDGKALPSTRVLNKQQWVSLLAASGMTETDMQKWHVEFEKMSPEAHHDFLESLGIPTDEVGKIRNWSQKENKEIKKR